MEYLIPTDNMKIFIHRNDSSITKIERVTLIIVIIVIIMVIIIVIIIMQ